MISERLTVIIDQKKQTGDNSAQLQLLSLILTKFAEHQENTNDDGVGETWALNNQILAELAELSPDTAFHFGLELVNLPYRNYLGESYRGWLRGNGLALLCEKPMTKQLITHLLKSDELFLSTLRRFLSTNLILIREPADLAKFSYGFNCIAALKLAIHIINLLQDERFVPLGNKVQQLLVDPNIRRVVTFFMEDEETSPFVEDIVQLMT